MKLLIALFSALLLCQSCNREPQAEAVEPCSDIMAPRGKPPFDERYQIQLDLPISEAAFLKILDSLELSYYKIGEGELLKLPYEMRTCTHYDLTNIPYGYSIYDDDYDASLGYRESFVALVNSEGAVEYIESQYSYASTGGPLDRKD